MRTSAERIMSASRSAEGYRVGIPGSQSAPRDQRDEVPLAGATMPR